MRALWLEAGQVDLRDVGIPDPPPGEARIRVIQAGVCNTDLELCRGYYPYKGILGHEFVGTVVAVGDTRDGSWLGRRVVGEINAVCHDCDACRRGDSHHCSRRTVLGIVSRHGAFADYLLLPTENLHCVPDTLNDDEAVFTEPVAAALQIQQQIQISAADRVVVFGDGKLGLLIAQTLRCTGAQILLVGHHEANLQLVAQRGIATSLSAPSPATQDIAIECTGSPKGFAAARVALRPRGTLVLKSTYAGQLSVDASSLVVDEIQLVGSRCGPFDRALECLQTEALEVGDLIHARYGLDDAVAAMERAGQSSTLKVMLETADHG